MPDKIAIVEEAKSSGQICPFKFAAAWPPPSAQWGGTPIPPYCDGARCMAWRWYATHVPAPVPASTEEFYSEGQTMFRHKPGDPHATEKRGDVYGYCGLAGDPSPLPVPGPIGAQQRGRPVGATYGEERT